MKNSIILMAVIFMLFSSHRAQSRLVSENDPSKQPFRGISAPYARYWWFASMIQEKDIRYNMDWLKSNGFGGVELAWVYPLNARVESDTSITPRQEWLSPEWRKKVAYAISYADRIGLGCDLTLGTLWPFGDSKVPFEQATRRYGDPQWRQKITRSWEYPKEGFVVDHLNPKNYLPYFERLLKAFPHQKTAISQNYFIDSWEVETRKLWTEGLEQDFKRKYGYDITAYMESIYEPSHAKYLYDYMGLLSEKVIEFYRNFSSSVNQYGAFSRGQCSGAPCDVLSAYACLDIPEGEALLYEPEYNTIPASAAVLSGKKVVSAETFTCLYGWPSDYIRQEQTADLKLLADALFANGVNHIIWHGKPHNPKGQDTVSFYASVHAGPKGALAEEIPAFNRYLETVSTSMKKGRTYTDVAVYLPLEDAWMAGEMPAEQQFKWAWGFYEMRYVYFPDELAGYHPIWINSEFLEKGKISDGIFKVGDASFTVLYVDVTYLDYRTLKRLVELAGQGLQIICKRRVQEPGAVPRRDYNDLAERLEKFPSVHRDLPLEQKPFVTGERLPPFWSRLDGHTLYIFFAHPKAKQLKFPLEYGQSYETETVKMPVTVHMDGHAHDLMLRFKPYQSLLYKIEKGKVEPIDIRFSPKIPVVKSRPPGYKPPWIIR
jgi:hypothetical protein